MQLSLQAFVIIVEDIDGSRRFYQDALGQQVAADHGPNVVFSSGLSIWEAGHANRIIFGGEPEKKALCGCDNLEIYFETDDIDSAFNKLEAAGARIIHPIKEEPWGQLTFRCYDPDGHMIEVGEPMPAIIKRLFGKGYTPEQIVERTSMPMELVLQTIGYPRFC